MQLCITLAIGFDLSTILLPEINGSFPNYNLFEQYLGMNHFQVAKSLRFSDL
jgi:hypothetical protein